MAPEGSAVAARTSLHSLDSAQTLRASTALLRKIQSDSETRKTSVDKSSLLADADKEDVEDVVPVWLVLTTKKHIIDKKRLKPGKIQLPHPYINTEDESLRICLIAADPQRKYKDIVESPAFPTDLGKRITRVLGLEKLKAKYKSFESRRQLLGEYDVFLADDRIITYLPGVLGKVFYKGGSKRPIPVDLQGKRQSVDEAGNKRRKLSEGAAKVTKSEVKPQDVAKEIERAVGSALVHLAPSTTTVVKVGTAGMEAAHLQENVEVVVQGLVEKYVPQQWRNVRAVHIKGPNTAALPVWMTDELWVDEQDVLDQAPPVKEKSKKRKRGALADAVALDELEPIEVPGPDGKMRRIEAPSAKRKSGVDAEEVVKPAKKRKSDVGAEAGVDAQAMEKAEKQARKEALKKQKEEAKKAVSSVIETKQLSTSNGDDKKKARKSRMKAADLI